MELEFSDYGSACSSSSSTPWSGLSAPPPPPSPTPLIRQLRASLRTLAMDEPQRARSLADLTLSTKQSVEEARMEFKMNGYDTPYDPDEDNLYVDAILGPPSAYLRQKSWPAPDATPAAPMPIAFDQQNNEFSYAVGGRIQRSPSPPSGTNPPSGPSGPSTSSTLAMPVLSQAQLHALQNLPPALLHSLADVIVRAYKQAAPAQMVQECRFCKNNGEQSSFVRSHSLKGRDGRVSCPVLRALVCARCGASGDRAHTLTYCPLATDDERRKSAGMMRSLRQASGRRRQTSPAATVAVQRPLADTVYKYTATGVSNSGPIYRAPLDPVWAALEEKLSKQ